MIERIGLNRQGAGHRTHRSGGYQGSRWPKPDRKEKAPTIPGVGIQNALAAELQRIFQSVGVQESLPLHVHRALR